MVWLATHVETGGIIGTIQSYDGAGMSAGLQHEIAVFPRTLDEQGPLFKSLDRVRDSGPSNPEVVALMKAFDEVGWLLDPNGVLREKGSGRVIPGSEIRQEFTPDDGKVPSSGPKWEKAKKWALLFFSVYNHPNQVDILVKLASASMSSLGRFERPAYKQITNTEDPSVLVLGQNIRPDQDLALCVYQSHAVNAPSIAKNVLLASRPDSTSEWPGRFLKALNDTKWGNWDRRWIKTRRYAMKLWPMELFEDSGIMPEDP
jgi:hypothetical protein